MKHPDGTIDNRYSINKEWCGQTEAKFIIRFCNRWIDKADTIEQAEEIALRHAEARNKLLNYSLFSDLVKW